VDAEPEHEGRGGGRLCREKEAAVRDVERLEIRGRCEEAARVARQWAG
jgi:hypothetical protein